MPDWPIGFLKFFIIQYKQLIVVQQVAYQCYGDICINILRVSSLTYTRFQRDLLILLIKNGVVEQSELVPIQP